MYEIQAPLFNLGTFYLN